MAVVHLNVVDLDGDNGEVDEKVGLELRMYGHIRLGIEIVLHF